MNLYTLLSLGFALLYAISTVAGAYNPVVDWQGVEVQVGVPYDVWAVGQDRGPICIGKTTSNSECIHYVIDRRNGFNRPDPVVFTPADSSETRVLVRRDYNIQFDVHKDRAFNTWKVNLDVASTDHNFITTGGDFGNPGCWNANSWFQLAVANESEHLYKLISNPQTCTHRDCPVEITFVTQDGEDRLYLNQDQFLHRPAIELRFVKHSPSKLLEAI